MKWQQLVQAAAIYDRELDYDRFYRAYLQDRDDRAWWDPTGPSAADAERLFLFLNQWKCRLSSGPDDVDRFRAATTKAARVIALVRHESLSVSAFDPAAQAIISEAFQLILNAFAKRNSTAASKALHMYNRRLFVMWDKAIRAGYAVDATPESYAEVFLPRVQREAHEAIESIIADGRAAPEEAVEMIESQCSGTPLAKLVDQYNYCKFTLSAEELWQ